MNIHYIVTDFAPNATGFAIAFKNFCIAISNNPEIENIFVYSPIKPNEELHPKIKVILTDKIVKSRYFPVKYQNKIGEWGSRIYLFNWINNFKKCKDDIFIIESIYLVHIAYLLKNKYPDYNIIVRIHGTFPEIAYWGKDKYRLYAMKLLSAVEKIAVTTYHYIDYINSYFEPNISTKRKYYILPNILPDNTPISISTTDSLKKTFLQLGRMDENGYFQKAFQDVLQALYFLEGKLDHALLQQIEYVVIGDGELSENFQEGLKKLKYIRYTYYKKLSNSEVQTKIDNATAVLLPSRVEGMSMFATEVLAKGKAFIATTNGGLRDMVFDKYNGISVRPFDYLEIANAIEELTKKPELSVEYGKNSRKLFESKFNYSCLPSYLNVLFEDLK